MLGEEVDEGGAAAALRGEEKKTHARRRTMEFKMPSSAGANEGG